jgi:hypothetical protein
LATVFIPEFSMLSLLLLSTDQVPSGTMFMLVRRRANSESILGIAIRVPDVSTSKWVKTATVKIVGAPTRAVDKDSARMWAEGAALRIGGLIGRPLIDSSWHRKT